MTLSRPVCIVPVVVSAVGTDEVPHLSSWTPRIVSRFRSLPSSSSPLRIVPSRWSCTGPADAFRDLIAREGSSESDLRAMPIEEPRRK